MDIIFSNTRGAWPLECINIAAPSGSSQLNAVILGAGLSIAARPASLDWRGLVRAVAEELHEPLPEGFDPVVESMQLSWHYAMRPTTAEPSQFQTAVKDVLSHYESSEPLVPLRQAFATFLEAIHCDVIIDLNYDNVAERLLETAGISFYRTIGSQRDVEPPLPNNTVLLWKLHGSLDSPSTIVLSPTEYQRLYEINDLGTALMDLGQALGTVWTIGVGLSGDDVWSYITAKAKGLNINTFWLSNAATSVKEVEKCIKRWAEIVKSPRSKRITVFAALLPVEGQPETSMASRLGALCNILYKGPLPRPQSRPSVLNRRAQDRHDMFDKQFTAAVEQGNLAARQVVIEAFQADYNNLRYILLASTHLNLSGPRWLPALRSGTEAFKPSVLLNDLCAVLCKALELAESVDGENNRGLLCAAVVQFIVAYVFEILEHLGLEHEYTLCWPEQESLLIPQDAIILVGANPFEDIGTQDVNPLHFYRNQQRLILRSPMSVGQDQPSLSESEDMLLTEDEWEVGVRHIFYLSKPMLRLGSQEFHLERILPIYPWGFRMSELPRYRRETKGLVTRAWHRVSTRLDTHFYICKGGSLRDRSPRTFTIAGRGKLRIGEYDEFVIPAYR